MTIGIYKNISPWLVQVCGNPAINSTQGKGNWPIAVPAIHFEVSSTDVHYKPGQLNIQHNLTPGKKMMKIGKPFKQEQDAEVKIWTITLKYI